MNRARDVDPTGAFERAYAEAGGGTVEPDMPPDTVPELVDWLRKLPRTDRGFSYEAHNWRGAPELRVGGEWADALFWIIENQDGLLDALTALSERLEEAVAVKRETFPILNSGGQTIDFQLVAEHGRQAQANHYQSVKQLAERGGLSWCELHAVLYDKPYQNMDANDAILACRELEARYLSALAVPPAPVTDDDIWLLSSAAENLRGGSQNEERRVDAAFRIASDLDKLRKRLTAALGTATAVIPYPTNAFITCHSDRPDYYVRFKFETLKEAQDFHQQVVAAPPPETEG